MSFSVVFCPRFGTACLAAALATVSAARKTYAIQDTLRPTSQLTVPFRMPLRVAGYSIADSGLAGGAVTFSYRGYNVTKLDVFIYQLPVADTSQSLVSHALRDEVESFKRSLPVGLSRGWYDDYRLAFETEEPVSTSAGSVQSFAVATVLTRGGAGYVSLFYIYALRGMFIKIRLTVPYADWGANPALNFPTQFIEQVAASP